MPLLLTPPWRVSLLVGTLLLACAPTGHYVWVHELPAAARQRTLLQPRDRVDVVVQGQETMSGQFDIRPEGQLVVPILGSVAAAGRTPEQLAVDIARKLHGLLAKPNVTVVLAARPPRTITVLGEVRNPGSYDSPRELGVLDAIARAGGLTPFADRDGVFVIRRQNPPQRIRFRFDDLAGGDAQSLYFELQDGDAVIVE